MARFIFSLDCEGKWGVADHLTPEHDLTLSREKLEWAYDEILRLLQDLDLQATFAFVGLFTLPADKLRDARLKAAAARLPYLASALAAIEASEDGWVGDWALEKVRRSGLAHEIGLHGLTHTPWTDLSPDQADLEMSLLSDLDFAPTTFIYPRNAVAHTGLLARHGIVGYRDVRPFGSRLASLLSEFDVFAQPDTDQPGVPRPIPAGYFVNWRSGPRKLVPVPVSRLRARRLFQSAMASDGVVHYWTHPENIASAPGTLAVLRAVLEEAARLRDAGRLVVQTQADYCASLAPAA